MVSSKAYMFLVNRTKGINVHKVVFSSFGGKSYSDNPRAISEKLHEMHPEFEIVWLFKNPEIKREVVPEYVRMVESESAQAYKELATAKFWVDNSPKRHVYKAKGQAYIQTWHGDRGFKKILYDCRNLLPSGHFKEGDLFEERRCDLAISGSQYGNNQYKSAFRFKGEILSTGCPRNDKLVENNSELAETIKISLGIEATTKIFLYAPTFRKEASRGKTVQDVGAIDLHEVLHALETKTKEQWICLTRAHSDVAGLAGIPESEKIMDITSYEEMSDLLLISDLLITDYSSSAVDFALLCKPIILYQNDREEYLRKDRSFYFDIDQSPFLVVMNQVELINLIKMLDLKAIPQNCKEILEFYGTKETGKASEAVVNYMVAQIKWKSFWRKRIGNFLKKGPFQWMPDKLYLKLRFYVDLGQRLNLESPRTYNEKLQWLKLNDRRPEMIQYVDKYDVREYIKKTIGEKYLVPLLGVYNRFEEIDFERLPKAFVLKCTHDSGGYVICRDRSRFKVKAAKRKLKNRLKQNYYYRFREWPYKHVKPRIICEEYLQDNITDYKFMCFHGEPKLIQVHRDRGKEHTLDFYDVNWEKTEIRRFTKTAEGVIPKPQCLEEMLWIARKLSGNEIHVRIDLYEVEGKVYFGEKTYYSGSGLVPFAKEEYDESLGSWIHLPMEQVSGG